MIEMDAPFLELGFYFSELSGDETIARVFGQLAAGSASCQGTVDVICGANIREHAFPGLTDLREASSRTVTSNGDVEGLLADKAVRVLKIMMQDMPGFPPGTELILAQTGIPRACIDYDHNPVAIWLDGSVLCHAPGRIPTKARQLGKQTLGVFRGMMSLLHPAYAAVTVDYGLECPCALRRDPRTLAFCDFYLSEAFVGKEALEDVRCAAPGAYHERTQHGQLTCSSEYIAPDNAYLTGEAGYALSEFCGRLIASMRPTHRVH